MNLFVLIVVKPPTVLLGTSWVISWDQIWFASMRICCLND